MHHLHKKPDFVPAHKVGALRNDDARLTSVLYLSVAYIGPKSRTERPRKTKIGGELAHVTQWLGHHFQGQQVKGQLAGGILWRLPAQLV